MHSQIPNRKLDEIADEKRKWFKLEKDERGRQKLSPSKNNNEEGFRMSSLDSKTRVEDCLVLKQGAEIDRSHSIKGQKDRTDILNLLINDDIDHERYYGILSKDGLEKYSERLRNIVNNAKKEFSYLGVENLRKRKLLKGKITEKLEKAMRRK